MGIRLSYRQIGSGHKGAISKGAAPFLVAFQGSFIFCLEPHARAPAFLQSWCYRPIIIGYRKVFADKSQNAFKIIHFGKDR